MHLNVPSAVCIGSVMGLAALLAAPPASADKPAEPAESGMVERFDALGGHVVGPVPTEVGDQTLPVLVVVGWDDATTFCSGGAPVVTGTEQVVATPSGNLTVVVHNADIPILVFDVSAASGEEDFLEQCTAGEIEPFATGTAKQRPVLHISDRVFSNTVKTRGVVTDATGQDWTVQSLLVLREVAGESEPAVLRERVTLTTR